MHTRMAGRFYGEGARTVEHSLEAAAPDAWAPQWGWTAWRLGPSLELEHTALGFTLDGGPQASSCSLHV